MRRPLVCVLVVILLMGNVGLSQDGQRAVVPSATPTAPQSAGQFPASSTVPSLSPQAMDALVAGIAFYPDTIIELILDASQYPDAMKQATQSHIPPSAEQTWPTSIQTLRSHGEILQQLDQNAVITARLALAARTQLADVWRAIDRVRTQFEEQARQSGSQQVEAITSTVAGYPYPTGAFIAGFWTAQVVDELRVWYQATIPVAMTYGEATATVEGPNGNSATVHGSGGAAQVTVGDTTYFGAAGEGSVSTSQGTVINGQGKVTGQATQSADGASYQTDAAGSVSSNTGQYAEGQHSASGGYTVKADGSADFNRQAETDIKSSNDSSSIQHSGSGTYTGQGTGSYQGSTDIQSTYGHASVETSASDGQVHSAITTGQGTQTVTLGDGQIGSDASSAAERTATAPSTSRMARPASVPALSNRFNQAAGQWQSPTQWQSANRAMSDAWSRLGQQAQHLNRNASVLGNHNAMGIQGPTTFARPNNGILGGSNLPALNQVKTPQKSAPSRRSGGGARRGRR